MALSPHRGGLCEPFITYFLQAHGKIRCIRSLSLPPSLSSSCCSALLNTTVTHHFLISHFCQMKSGSYRQVIWFVLPFSAMWANALSFLIFCGSGNQSPRFKDAWGVLRNRRRLHQRKCSCVAERVEARDGSGSCRQTAVRPKLSPVSGLCV